MIENKTELLHILSVFPRIMRVMRGDFAPRLSEHVKKSEANLLVELLTHPGRSMKHYVAYADMESGSFTYLTDKLEGKGLLRRLSATDDRRKTVLELTDKGERLTAELIRQFEAHMAMKVKALDDCDVKRLSEATLVLEDILKKLEKK